MQFNGLAMIQSNPWEGPWNVKEGVRVSGCVKAEFQFVSTTPDCMVLDKFLKLSFSSF